MKEDDPMQKIAEWFIKPLLKYRPESMSLKEWLEWLFHTKDRDVKQYIATRQVFMMGHYKAAPYIRYQGVGYRHVDKGEIVFVRHDTTMPNLVEVEIVKDTKEYVFELSREEWLIVKKSLELMPEKKIDRNRKRREYNK